MYTVLSYFEPSFFVKYELLEYNGIIMWEIVVRIIWSSFLTPLTHLTHNSSRVPACDQKNEYLPEFYICKAILENKSLSARFYYTISSGPIWLIHQLGLLGIKLNKYTESLRDHEQVF